MDVTRRSFLKLSAGAAVLSTFGGLGFDVQPALAMAADSKLQWTKQSTSICCYCAVGCGLIVSTKDPAQQQGAAGAAGTAGAGAGASASAGKKGIDALGEGRCVNVEGDPDHPINEGSLCPKGASIGQLTENAQRPKGPLYRAANSSEWKDVSWDWALGEIAQRVKKTRDASFSPTNAAGQKVNRTEAIASFGSAAMDNEECWAYQSVLRSLGLVFVEHQARL